MTDKNTCYLERSLVRAIICGVADEHVHVAEGILADIDALPIITAVDIAWAEFYHRYRPTTAELEELVRRFSSPALSATDHEDRRT